MTNERQVKELLLGFLKEVHPEIYNGLRKTLKYYDKAYLIYEYGEWDYGVGITIKAKYGSDYNVHIIDKSYFTYTEEELETARKELAQTEWF